MRPLRPASSARAIGRVTSRTRALERRNVSSAAAGGSSGFAAMWSADGLLATHTGGMPWIARWDGEITEIHLAVGTAPTGSGVTVRVNKNGVSLGTATVAAGATTASFVPASPTFVTGDSFTVDITAVGSTTPGQKLVVQIVGTVA